MMSEENELRKDGYNNEGDLFSKQNAPKPLFPEEERPIVKPLFGSSENKIQKAEALVEAELNTAGPVAFVDSQKEIPAQKEILSRPQEGPTAYIERPAAPDISEPIIVQTKEILSKEQPQEMDIPAGIPVSEKNMTTPAATSANSSYQTKAEPEQNLKAARPLPKQKAPPRYGKIRVREAILPENMDKNRVAISVDPSASSIGKIMQNARIQAGLSLDEVFNATRINKSYIEALETDDFHNLPSGIFPSAYARTLCEAYRLNEESRETILNKIKENSGPHDQVPEQLIHHLEQDVQKNLEEEKRINKIFYSVVACASLIVILMIAGILMLAISLRKPAVQKVETNKKTEQIAAPPAVTQRMAPVETFDTQKLESLTPPQIPSVMRELRIPNK